MICIYWAFRSSAKIYFTQFLYIDRWHFNIEHFSTIVGIWHANVRNWIWQSENKSRTNDIPMLSSSNFGLCVLSCQVWNSCSHVIRSHFKWNLKTNSYILHCNFPLYYDTIQCRNNDILFEIYCSGFVLNVSAALFIKPFNLLSKMTTLLITASRSYSCWLRFILKIKIISNGTKEMGK